MAFTTRQVAFLQALAAQRPESRSDKVEAARYFCDNHGIGALAGKRVDYQSIDFERAVHLLRTNGLPIVAMAQGASRADAARFPGQSEKSGTRGPSANAVAIKGSGGCELAGWELSAPPGAFVTLTVEQACTVSADVLLVVENKETFRYLESYSWIDYQGLRVLSLFRGDGATSEGDVQAALRARTEPVWAFMDFDPAGLGMASKLPRLARLILPPAPWLERAATGERGRVLYDQSLGMWESVLDVVEHALVAAAWNLLKSRRHGVAQEGMLHYVPGAADSIRGRTG